MPSTLNRKVSAIGTVWQNGRYIKRMFLSPALRTVLLNLKRVINQDQNTIFDEAAEAEGVTLPRESNTYYFNENSIHTSVIFDPNKLALWIFGSKTDRKQTSGKEVLYKITIYLTIGAGDFNSQAQLITVFLEGLNNLIEAMPPQELVFDWPDNIASESRENYQPTMKISNLIINDPDTSAGAMRDSKGPIGSISFDLSAFPRENKA